MPTQIDHRELAPGLEVITVTGRIMLGRECQIIESLVPELIEQKKLRVIFDLSGVARIDSTGIGRFIQTFTLLQPAGGRLAIAGASKHVRDCFRVTRLDQVFRFYADMAEAAAALTP